MTLFWHKFNFEISSKVLDKLFLEGYVSLFKLSLAILKINEKHIVNSSFEDILLTLNSTFTSIDWKELFDSYEWIKITQDDIEVRKKTL